MNIKVLLTTLGQHTLKKDADGTVGEMGERENGDENAGHGGTSTVGGLVCALGSWR